VATTYFDQTSVRPEAAPTTIPANLQLARANIELMEYTAQDVLYTAFPLFHVNANFTSVIPGYGLLGRGHDRHATVESELICYRRHANFSWARSDLLEDRRFAVVAPNILQCLD
jgi:hypothetical protein